MLELIGPTVLDGPPWLDTALSWTLLDRAGAGEMTETLRLYRPARVLAFGPADRLLPGFEAARDAARALGFTPVHRLAGGHAAVFHEQTLAFSWIVPEPRARLGIHKRFEAMASLVQQTLVRLGIDARIGAVPGEYCPGDYSVNARRRTKLMGVGQRVLPGAAYLGGVLVIDGAELVREALEPVYRALALDWDPATSGSVREEVSSVTWDDVAGALIETLGALRQVTLGVLDPAIIEQARGLEARVMRASG